MGVFTLHDSKASTQACFLSTVSARKYQTQSLTATSKRHSSNSWGWK